MKTLSVFALGLLSGLGAFAQEVPKVDLFFGYSFLRVNSDGNIPAFTANGGLFNAGFNVNNHFAIEAEFAGYHNGNINNVQLDTTSYSYLFGPRFSVGRSKRVDPYVHALFGVNRATTSIAANSVLIPIHPVVPPAGVTLPTPSSNGRYEASQSNFGMAIGGGLDIKMTKRVTLRPIQLDYYLTRFQTSSIEELINNTSSNKNQNNLRYAAGLMFSFGAK
jgi:opacity protein-like surface antigen